MDYLVSRVGNQVVDYIRHRHRKTVAWTTYLSQMAGKDRQHYLFATIGRATRRAFVIVYAVKTMTNAKRFLKTLANAALCCAQTILTYDGKGATYCFVTSGECNHTGEHVFDQLCAELGNAHFLTRHKRPRKNCMVEYYYSYVADLLRILRFISREVLGGIRFCAMPGSAIITSLRRLGPYTPCPNSEELGNFPKKILQF